MRPLRLLPFCLLIAATGCSSGRVVVASGGSDPHPSPHVQGPVATLGVPPGHLPPPGQCRVWMPGAPPGHQAAPVPCNRLHGDIPPGAWVLYRPSKDRHVVELTVYHDTSPSVVVSVDWYDADSGHRLASHDGGRSRGKGHGKGRR